MADCPSKIPSEITKHEKWGRHLNHLLLSYYDHARGYSGDYI
jgi:hypothetical protein